MQGLTPQVEDGGGVASCAATIFLDNKTRQSPDNLRHTPSPKKHLDF